MDKVQIPVLSTSMGRGVVPDNHPLSVIAARSLALATADVVLVMGARYESISLHVVAPCMLLPSVISDGLLAGDKLCHFC